MEMSNMKNIVVLKNLPSNIVDEAFVILKQNKKIRKLELVEKNKKQQSEKKEENRKEYILKEAEMLIYSCIDKMENEEIKEMSNKTLKQKYNRLKKYSLVSSIILFISLVINFI